MVWAASNGYLDVVKWLHENRTEGCTTHAMDLAADNGQLDVIKWLHENCTEGCTTNEWLHQNRTEGCTTRAMDGAASSSGCTRTDQKDVQPLRWIGRLKTAI